MSSDVTTSMTESELRLVSSDFSSEYRMPVTVTDIPGTVVGGVVVGGVTCASFISDDADAAGDASPACCDDGIGVCAAACCEGTGITVLIRARATADAIGVFLSFMTFPLVLALAMPKTAGGDVSSGRAGGPLLAAIDARVRA